MEPRWAIAWLAITLLSVGCNELSGLGSLEKVDGTSVGGAGTGGGGGASGGGGGAVGGGGGATGGRLAEPFGLTAGRHGTCVISMADSLARCWGTKPGDGSVSSLRPVVVQGITPVSICHGYDHRCAYDGNGDLYCWGNNDYGQLGDGTNVAKLVPTAVTTVSGVTKLSCGAYHTCIKTDTEHLCWGNNAYGQLGTGDTDDRDVPTAFTLPATTHFGTGAYHGCAVLETPEVMCWGRNDQGQLGVDPAMTPMAPTPQLVTGLPTFERVYPGVVTTCGRTTNTRELHCWGNNDHGQLGDGSTTSSLTPVHATGISRLGVLYPGLRHMCASDTSDQTNIQAYCWGANDHGQLGLSTSTMMFPSPQLIAEGLTDAGMGAKTSEHTCYIDADLEVMCAGLNDTGQLGDGTTDSRDSFERVLFPPGEG